MTGFGVAVGEGVPFGREEGATFGCSILSTIASSTLVLTADSIVEVAALKMAVPRPGVRATSREVMGREWVGVIVVLAMTARRAKPWVILSILARLVV